MQITTSGTHDWRDALPQLETPRLRLRPYSAEDEAASHRIMSAAETFRYSERGPMNSEESWARLLRHVGQWALFGYGLFAIEDRDKGELVGEAGFADFRRGLGPRFDDCPEATWTLEHSAWGRGYAEEAALAAHRWLAARHGVPRTVCLIHRDNLRSMRVASRLGYAPYDEIDFRGYRALLFERHDRLSLAARKD